jgi:class 3 adenylate cyclase
MIVFVVVGSLSIAVPVGHAVAGILALPRTGANGRSGVAELPSGTVTFLFTDLEGSTRLWESDREAMAAAVARHHALLDDAIRDRGGVVFSYTGDGVAAAFETARDALAAAVNAQRALSSEDWGDAGPLRARMGVHTGEGRVVGEQ